MSELLDKRIRDIDKRIKRLDGGKSKDGLGPRKKEAEERTYLEEARKRLTLGMELCEWCTVEYARLPWKPWSRGICGYCINKRQRDRRDNWDPSYYAKCRKCGAELESNSEVVLHRCTKDPRPKPGRKTWQPDNFRDFVNDYYCNLFNGGRSDGSKTGTAVVLKLEPHETMEE